MLEGESFTAVAIPFQGGGIGDVGPSLDLLDGSGNVLVGGIASSGGEIVRNFIAPTAGDYFLRVRGESNIAYQLAATRNSDINRGGNDAAETAADITFYDAVIGALAEAGLSQQHFYSFQASAGDSLTLATETPATDVANIVNTLDPFLELIDPSGQVVATDDNGADGRNATINFDALTSGNYIVRLGTSAGAGEYVLRVTGNTVEAVALEVVATDPADGSVLQTIPAEIRVEFSAAFDPASVDAGDMMINGQPATGVQIIDGNTVAFQVNPSQIIGDVTFVIAADTITGLAGGSNVAFTGSFFVDAGSPRIIATTWNGQSFPDNRTLPTGSLTVGFEFSEPINMDNVDINDISIFDEQTFSTIAPQGIAYDDATNTLSAAFKFLGEGGYFIAVFSGDESFEDLVGNDLDGEAVGGQIDGTVTGDGNAGGDYFLSFNLDGPTLPIEHVMSPATPLGSMTYQMFGAGEISYFGDSDSYSLTLDAGELLDVTVTPRQRRGNLTLEILDDAGAPCLAQRPAKRFTPGHSGFHRPDGTS